MSAFGDWRVTGKITRLAAKLGVDVLHGHGAKGGAYARLAGRRLKRKGMKVKAIYTPHGGSLHLFRVAPDGPVLHHGRTQAAALDRRASVRKRILPPTAIVELVGEPRCPVRIVPNGLYRHEFYEPMLADDAVDFVFIGELRHI